MQLDEQKLIEILTEQREDFKRHVGLLIEDTVRKFGLVQEAFQGVVDKLEELRGEIISIRKELEEIRMLLFRKTDLERLEALEVRVAAIEKRLAKKDLR